MGDTYLQFDEFAAARFGQTIADAVERGITEAVRAASRPLDRDSLAAMVMRSHIASGTDPEIVNPGVLAAYCHRIADAMIAEAKKGAPRG